MYEQLTEEQMQDLWNKEAAGEESPVEETSPVEAEPVAEQSPAESSQPEPDPYAGLPDVVKAKLSKIDQIEQSNAQLMHELKSATGRVAAMQREFDLAKQARAQAQAGGDEAPSQKQISAAAKNPEKWEKLKGDFPDWADAVEEFVASRATAQPTVDPQRVAHFVQSEVARTREEMAVELEKSKIEAKYENWTDVVKTPDFVNWLQSTTPEIQALASSPKAKDAIRMLDMFEASRSKPVAGVKQERGARLAVAATQKGQSAPPAKSPEEMTPEELWAYEAKQREKRRAY